MGWLFGSEWYSKADLVKHLTEGNGITTIAKSVRGNTLWAVHEVPLKDTGEKLRIIACYLMSSDKQNSGGWGYKDMEECMGPCYYDCPLKFFDMVPCPAGEYAAAWREKVRAFHKAKAAKTALRKTLTVGCKVRLIESCTVLGKPVTEPLTITSLKPLRGVLGFMPISIRPRHIAEVLPAA